MYKLNDESMFYDYADGQAIVINFKTGVYYATSSLASEVLNRLISGKSSLKIAEAIKALPGCPEDMDVSFKTFINELKEKEILLDGETTEGGDDPMPKEVLEDGFLLTLEECNEIKDLILADVVCQVDPLKDWPQFEEDNN